MRRSSIAAGRRARPALDAIKDKVAGRSLRAAADAGRRTARPGPVRRRRCAPGCAPFRSSRRRAERRRRSSRSCRMTRQDQWERVAVPFTRGTYALDPDGTAEQRDADARHAAPLRARVGARRRRSPPTRGSIASIFTDSFTYPSVNVIAKVPGRDREAARRVRALQRASGSRRRALHGERRQHLERRRRQRDDVRGAAGDRPRDVGVAGPPVGAVHLAWRRRARADGLALVRRSTRPCRSTSIVAVPQRRHDGPQRSEDGGAARRAAAASQLAGARRHRARREQGRVAVRRSIRPGTIRIIARAGTTAAIICRTRATACRRCSSRRCCTPDYHTPFDNPDRIDVAKLTKMTRWMYATGRAVAEADKAPAVDPTFKLERCRDFTGRYGC